MSTIITVVGTVATEPQTIGPGTPAQFCAFRLASNERRYDSGKGEWVDGHTSWFSVHAFRGLGEHARASLKVGDRVIVHGRMRVRDWVGKEKSGTSAEIDADALGHDLRWGVSTFSKRAKPEPPNEERDADGFAQTREREPEPAPF